MRPFGLGSSGKGVDGWVVQKVPDLSFVFVNSVYPKKKKKLS